MPRQPKLSKKNGHWYTRAGGRPIYFGKVGEVTYRNARKAFRLHLQQVENDRRPAQHHRRVSVLELCSRHLDWVEANRSKSSFDTRKSLLSAWCNHRVTSPSLIGRGKLIGEMVADLITRKHLEEYLQAVRTTPSKRTGNPLGEVAQRAIVVAVKAAWNWASNTEEDGGGGLLPEGLRPLAKVPRPHVPPKDLTESDLPTDDEITRLLAYAAADSERIRGEGGRYRPRLRHEWRTGEDNPYAVFEAMLRTYYATGARTGELCAVNVRDFHPHSRQLTLGRHKRVRTQSVATLRVMQLGQEAYEIVKRHCQGKTSDEPIFTQANGDRWTTDWVGNRFAEVRSLAGVRDRITVYSFRDLYISELLREGVEPFEVSKMAGTSLGEIEKTYGHFYNSKLAEAQAKLDAARALRRQSAAGLKVIRG